MFSASNMSRAAHQAARYAGLTTIHKFEILDNQTKIVDIDEQDYAEKAETVVIRAYSKSGKKSVDITAGNLFLMETEYQDAPLARLA